MFSGVEKCFARFLARVQLRSDSSYLTRKNLAQNYCCCNREPMQAMERFHGCVGEDKWESVCCRAFFIAGICFFVLAAVPRVNTEIGIV